MEGLLASFSQTDPFFRDVRDLVFADGPAERTAVCDRNSELRSERGEAALEVLVSFAAITGSITTLPVLQEVQEWVRSRPAADAPAALGPGSTTYDVLAHFNGAAIAADREFLRTQDASKLRQGIDVWKRLVATGRLIELPPESLVQAYITVSMLYARRYELDTASEDLELAFRYLREAQRHVIPGSADDLLARISSASWLMLRFEADHDPADLDQAIAGWLEVHELAPANAADRGVAAANLGRALLIRQGLNGSREDLRVGRAMLLVASGELPPEHPALPIVHRQLASLALKSSTGS